MTEIEKDWYSYHDKICALARFLNLQDYFTTRTKVSENISILKNSVDDVIYYFEKPWKYEDEYKRYLKFIAFINRDERSLDFDEAGYFEFTNWEKENE
tara:strand:+ start:69 stop:362 length:294 start_codon:yes stop_codon:yes gene_type:complete